MERNSDIFHTSTAAKEREPEPHILIRELTTFHNRLSTALPPEASSELGTRYHRFLDQMRDAYLFALDHRSENKIALRDLAALERQFGQQVMGAKSLRFCSSFARMCEDMGKWKNFCKEQIFKGGPNAMIYLYGVEGWEDL